MTDKDFWASIKSIEDGGFEPEGLKKLEYYADKFIGNQLVYKRFSPFEQHGCAEGGNVHVIASILAGAGVGTDKLTAPEGSFKRELQCGEIQEKRIEIWAKNVGCWIDDVETALPKQLGEMVAEGGEAKVYYHGASLIKTIGLDYFVLPVLALDRISLHNAYFPETKMIVLGFGRNSDGEFQIVAEQSFIQGEQMGDEEIENYAKSLGFKLINPKNWTYATPEIYLSDLHDENVIKSASGNVFVVDCDIRINTPGLKCGGNRELTNEMEVLF